VLKQTNVKDPQLGPLETLLQQEGRRIAEFTPYRPDVAQAERASVPPFLHNTAAVVHPALARPGPTIEVWKID
jgi:hypothetical protein